MEAGEKYDNPCPKLKANCLNRLFFWWLNPLFWYAKNNELRAKDMYNALPEDLSQPLGDRLEKFWKRELKEGKETGRKCSLLRATIQTVGWSYLRYAGHIILVNVVLMVLQLQCLSFLIWHFDPRANSTKETAYLFATGITVVTLVSVLLKHHIDLKTQEIGMRLRIACSSLIYRKLMRLSCSSLRKATSGTIINLLSSDVARFETLFLFLHYIWIAPLQGAVVTYVIWRRVGLASLVGVILITLQIIPLQAFIGKQTAKLRGKIAIRTDERVRVMSEIIGGISIIKMYTWEKLFEGLVSRVRSLEINVMNKLYYYRAATSVSYVYVCTTCMYFTVLAFVLQGNMISADVIFTIAPYFNIMIHAVALCAPRAVASAAEARVSIQRIQKFLLMEEISEVMNKPKNSNESIVVIKNVTASWDTEVISNTLYGINVNAAPMKFHAIIGAVGAGKSSMLKLILGELQPLVGEVQIGGSVSYASQEPWLFHGSIRANILFGQDYDENKYAQVTKACALLKDFEQLPHGDKTYVGDRGTTLSGGQCARVNLARAVYREADIYLLDDPLSAVDTRVGRHLLEECINGYLKNKTRILVTHQAQYLKTADNIILLKNGQVEAQGSFADIQKIDMKYLNIPKNEEEEKIINESIEVDDTIESFPAPSLNIDDKLEAESNETEELISKRGRPQNLYSKYFHAGGSYFNLFMLALGFIVVQVLFSGCDYWLAFWTKQEEIRLRNELSTPTVLSKPSDNSTKSTNSTTEESSSQSGHISGDLALYIYGGLVAAFVLTSIIKYLWFFKICTNASKRIHRDMLSCLLRAPMSFFDAHPAGRILNRFSKDTAAMDDILPMRILETADYFLIMIGTVAQVIIIHWWMVFPFIIICTLYLQIRNIYVPTAQSIKRLEGSAKSPVFSHTNSTISGLLTIRSSKAQDIVCKQFDVHQDAHTSSYFLSIATSTAFGFWLDIVTTAFVTFITYSFVVLDNGNNTFAGNVGLAISLVLGLCGRLARGMRFMADMITNMTSVERIVQFTQLDQEGPFESEPGQKPTSTWPMKGTVQFDQLYLKYSESSDPVLKNLNFTVEPGMKVGIVGRTGAGKSSLISALFRLAKFDGSLKIDSIDTKLIGLHDLRNKLSIIPQEPMLFSASLRDNLDPFHEFGDAELWSALEDVELKKAFVSLDYAVDHGGSNLSTGQRQLLCLARAVVKKNKILVLDEATANVDTATDTLIQKTIRSKFNECTVLTIAHRLNTIMDSDKVLVMDHGLAVEFDHPYTLLQKKDGFLSKMVEQTGKIMIEHLTKIAHDAFQSKSQLPQITDERIPQQLTNSDVPKIK